MWNLRSFQFSWHPWHPWGRLSSGDIWFELEKSSKSHCAKGHFKINWPFSTYFILWKCTQFLLAHLYFLKVKSNIDNKKHLKTLSKFCCKLMNFEKTIYCTLQSCTGPVQGKNRVFPVKFFSQGNPCNENRVSAMRKGVPCNENRGPCNENRGSV